VGRLHAPNEFFRIRRLREGTRRLKCRTTNARIWRDQGRQARGHQPLTGVGQVG